MINRETLQMQNMKKKKAIIMALVTGFIFTLLFWEHFNGGVASHHILHQKSLPAISNWWSGLLLPALTWLFLSRIEKRHNKQIIQAQQTNNLQRKILMLFIAGLILGILIAISFAKGYGLFLDNVLYIILLLSLIIPIYYPEFMLGFILGMTYTFGAILPTAFILILAAIGIITYKFIRPMIMKLRMIFINYQNKSPNRQSSRRPSDPPERLSHHNM